LQEVIDELGEFSRWNLRVSNGVLGPKLARAKATKASERARIDLVLADQLPPHEKKLSERARLREQQRNLMAAQRSDARKAAGKS
jgi:hypothetical protein